MSLLFALLFSLHNLVFFSLSHFWLHLKAHDNRARVSDMLEFANKCEIDFFIHPNGRQDGV